MPAIYKNGKQYAGIPDEIVTAWEVDDTMDLEEIDQAPLGTTDISDIGDGSLTGAIKANADNIEWKYLATVTGKVAINLPQNFKELSIHISNDIWWNFTFHILRIELGDTDQYFSTGAYFSASSYSSCLIICNTTRVILNLFNSNGNDISNSVKTIVYYK